MKNKKFSSIIDSFIYNKLLFLSTAVIIISFTAGALLFSLNKNLFISEFSESNKILLCNIMSNGFTKILVSLFIFDFLFVIIAVLSAFSLVGEAIIILSTACRTVGIGAVIGYFYNEFSTKGLLVVLLILVPGTFVQIFSILLTTEKSIQISNKLKRIINKRAAGEMELKNIAVIYFIISAMFFAAEIIKSLGFRLFTEMLYT